MDPGPLVFVHRVLLEVGGGVVVEVDPGYPIDSDGVVLNGSLSAIEYLHPSLDVHLHLVTMDMGGRLILDPHPLLLVLEHTVVHHAALRSPTDLEPHQSVVVE